jgi:hypothetical protein
MSGDDADRLANLARDLQRQKRAEADRRAKREAKRINGQGRPPDPPPASEHELPQMLWKDVRLSSWAGRDPPPRRWALPDWIPRLQTTGLYGIGGINKTDFVLQLAMAASLGLAFIGYQLERTPTYCLFCEDTEAEIVRRAQRIAAHYHRDLADFVDFHFVSLVGFEDTEFVSFDGPQLLKRPALVRFDQAIIEYQAKLCILDTAPDFFGGNEIVRREVTRFVRVLNAISMQRDCAILFTAHPSIRGAESGALGSGSTGWGAKVRARLSLHDPGEDDEDEDEKAARQRMGLPPKPTERRILVRQKSNYAAVAEALELVCRNGVFTTSALDPEAAADRASLRRSAVEAKFLELIPKAEAAVGYLHTSVTARDRYAPAAIAALPEAKGYSLPELTRAMRRLLAAGRLRLAPFGPPSRHQFKLVRTDPDLAANP